MKVAIVENTGKDFFLSRIRLSKFLIKKGSSVTVIVPDDGFDKKIRELGLKVLVVGKNIRGKNILDHMEFALDFYKILRENDFDIVHCFRMQPNIIGGTIGGLLGLNVFNHVTGLGTLFSKKTLKYKLQQNLIKFCYKFNNTVFKTKCIFQNSDDVLDLGIKKNYKIIKGSAVNEDIFYPNKLVKDKFLNKLKSENSKIVLFVSRLVKSKGLDLLFHAVKELNDKLQYKIKLVVVGWVDHKNTDSHTFQEIDFYSKHDFVEFLGERNDISNLISISDICALPTSYREGTPRFLLEAMASGKPIVTSEMPGCKHLISNKNLNGVLASPLNKRGLTESLEKILNLDLLKAGSNSRLLYLNEFSEKIVYNKIYNYYKKI